ncbi:hypothetical protein ACFYT3_27110 [Nocardia amikacinitolerans]|uniref:hypothetical protein n=1 Tax=Nocardia amikacinitolerans TaxID=756689 RepID=UPI0036C92FBA
MPTGYSQCARPQFGRHFATGEDLRGNRTIELTALRRIEASVFGVWMSSQPAVAAVAGMVLLGEGLRGAQWGGVAMVVVAAAGSAWFAADSGRRAQDEMARRGRTDALSADAEPLKTRAGATSEAIRPERAAPELVH